jgi:hypothetical protein
VRSAKHVDAGQAQDRGCPGPSTAGSARSPSHSVLWRINEAGEGGYRRVTASGRCVKGQDRFSSPRTQEGVEFGGFAAKIGAMRFKPLP